MYSDNKQIRDVADVAAKIMAGLPAIEEELKGGQVKIDKNHNGKIDGQDFKILKGEKKGVVKEDDTGYQDRFAVKNGKAVKHNPEKGEHDEPHHVWADSPEHAVRKHATMNKPKTEEVELDEKISISYKVPTDNYNFGAKPGDKTRFNKSPNITRKMQLHRDVTAKAVKSIRAQGGNPANHPDIKINKEEIEQMDEVKMADLPSTKVQGRSYGASRPEPHAVDTIKGPNDAELKKIEAEKKKKKFSEMVNLYQDKGLKSLSEMLAKEESTEDEFNKEIEDAKAKDAGKKKNTEIAKGAVQAVKTEETHTTVEVIDLNDVNGVQYSEIELAQERTLTEPEMKKKEEIVKSMKKGLSGFKDRYGDRAKEVMYATATANAKKSS
jgi:hypothetical protein